MSESTYVQLQTTEGNEVFVEVAGSANKAADGFRAGVGSQAGKVVQETGKKLDEMIRTLIQGHTKALLEAVESLERKPESTELNFALKVMGDTGPLGALCIGKLGAEANYQVKITWKNTHRTPRGPESTGDGVPDGLEESSKDVE